MIVGEPLSHIESKPLSWLVAPYFARGKLTILDGDPDMGKSLLAIYLAALVSRGGSFPGSDDVLPPGTAILIGAEDAAADTTRPRAEAAGADLDRIIFVPSADHPLPEFPQDIAALEDYIRKHNASLVVIDPLMAFISGKVAVNSDHSVRRLLSQLAKVAERTGAAIVLVRHLNKKEGTKALYRGLGSIGIIGCARTGLYVGHHPKDENLRVLAGQKGNLTGKVPSAAFQIRVHASGHPFVEWIGFENYTAEDLLRRRRTEKPSQTVSAKDRASLWLKDELSQGPRRVRDLLEAAAGAGIPERTLNRAKKDLGVQAQQLWDYGRNCGEWWWYDRECDWPKNAPFKKPFELEPLSPL